jgi:hypothetical protein
MSRTVVYAVERLLYIGESERKRKRGSMTTVDVVFKYGLPPGETEMRAVSDAREVYGIRKISFNETDKTVRVEFDATRLQDSDVANLLRNAGLDIESKVALA